MIQAGISSSSGLLFEQMSPEAIFSVHIWVEVLKWEGIDHLLIS